MAVEPYLNFDGRCEEALNFYRDALGAEVTLLMRFKDSPDQSMVTPAVADKIMHSAFRVAGSIVLASDGRCMSQEKFNGIALSLTVPPEQAEDRFNALANGGSVQVPLTSTFFATHFGMVQDRFGVGWMVIAPKPM